MYDKLVAKANNFDATGFDLKTNCDTDKSDQEKKLVMQTKIFLKIVDLLKKQIKMLKVAK